MTYRHVKPWVVFVARSLEGEAESYAALPVVLADWEQYSYHSTRYEAEQRAKALSQTSSVAAVKVEYHEITN